MASPWIKLIKTKPTVETINAATTEIATDGPRGAILLGSTLVESILTSTIAHHMVPLEDEEYDRLFRNYGPLSTFSARIKIAYAFRVIGPKIRDDLESLRELRNGFAHTQHVLDFEAAELADQLKRFNCLSSVPTGDQSNRRLFAGLSES